ncbi:MAG: glycosyl transferase family 2 [Bacteroidia bacterium]|nr:MAG: glycosyl transferase family 2 [Bacteroidia bacterium]
MVENRILFSIVVPVYNRPEELDELLESLSHQGVRGFEVIVVDDGSTRRCDEVCAKWETIGAFPLRYEWQQNTGPAGARNRAALDPALRGDYILFLDSDCIAPPNYLYFTQHWVGESGWVDLWGGPDAFMKSFTVKQKAISYAMTSPLTTGGIRGGGERATKFYPRTFNMGVRREAFRQVGGFTSDMRYGEDVDLSMRLVEQGFRSALFPDLFVYHKRRTTFGAFFRQVFHSGGARVDLSRRHKGSLKLVHLLPAIGVVLLILGMLIPVTNFQEAVFALALLYALLVGLHATYRFRSPRLGGLAILACAVMMLGYGLGYLSSLLGLAGREEG